MIENQCKDQVKEYLITNFLIDTEKVPLEDDVSFLENGIIDSTGILEVINFIQDTFGIIINDDEILPENLDSLNNIAAFVSRKVAS